MPVQSREELRRVPTVGDGLRFTDVLGADWQVFELVCASGTPCLVFESIGALRRIWRYPHSWPDLGAEELVELSWAR